MRRIGRLSVVAAFVAATWALPVLASPAGASNTNVKPTISSTEAAFSIPAGSSAAWMIRLWTLPTPSTLEGETIGSAGTITVKVPSTSNCDFQVDVLTAKAGTTSPKDFTWYSGLTAVVAGCGSAHCPPTQGVVVLEPQGSSHVPPTINSDYASFTIPAGKKQAWMLRLWTLPTPSTLLGQALGGSGTLEVAVPKTQTCQFQVDVKVAPAGTTNPNDFTWYSGITATL
jgi:hypothetical protein